jgi:hypothetical protein
MTTAFRPTRFLKTFQDFPMFDYEELDNYSSYKFKPEYHQVLYRLRYAKSIDYGFDRAFIDFKNILLKKNNPPYKKFTQHQFKKIIRFWEGKNGESYNIGKKYAQCNQSIEKYDYLSRDELCLILKQKKILNKKNKISDNLISHFLAYLLGKYGRLPHRELKK